MILTVTFCQLKYYDISTTQQFMNMSQNQVDGYVLHANLDFTNITTYSAQLLKGSFNGNGFTIANMSIKQAQRTATGSQAFHQIGLFYAQSAVQISNLVLDNIMIQHDCVDPLYDDVVYAAPLLASGNAVIVNVTVNNSAVTSTGTINRRAIGGLVGFSSNLQVTGCTALTSMEMRLNGDGRTVGFAMGGVLGAGSAIVKYVTASLSFTSDAQFHSVQVGGGVGRCTGSCQMTACVLKINATAPLSSNIQAAGAIGVATSKAVLNQVATTVAGASFDQQMFGAVANGSEVVLQNVRTTVQEIKVNGVATTAVAAASDPSIACAQCSIIGGTGAQYTTDPASQTGFDNGVPVPTDSQISSIFTLTDADVTIVNCTSKTENIACATNAICLKNVIGGVSTYQCTCTSGFVSKGKCLYPSCVTNGTVCSGRIDQCYAGICTDDAASLDSHLGMYIGIGVACGVVVIAGVVFVLWKCNKKKKMFEAAKKKYLDEMSSTVSKKTAKHRSKESDIVSLKPEDVPDYTGQSIKVGQKSIKKMKNSTKSLKLSKKKELKPVKVKSPEPAQNPPPVVEEKQPEEKVQ